MIATTAPFPTRPTAPPPVGLYPAVADIEYRRWAAWSQTDCKTVGRWDQTITGCMPAPFQSPAHLLAVLNGHGKPSTPDQEYGTLYHAFLLEPWRVDEQYHRVLEPINRRTNEGKARWSALVERFGADRIIESEDWETACAMARAAGDLEQVRKYVRAKGDVEISMRWDDPTTGLPCKGRADKIIRTDAQDILIDLKTTRCSHWSSFTVDAAKYGYHVQAAMYADGYEILTGRRPRVLCIAQEKTAPYPAVVYEWREDEMTSGRVIYRAALRVIAQCLKTNDWPSYTASVIPMSLPEWGMADDATTYEGADLAD